MKREDKELLLKDLCARLPYGVKFQGEDSNVYTLDTANYFVLQVENMVFKPYLRPMSSMTEEEKGDINNIIHEFGNKWFESGTPDNHWSATFWECSEITDYLLSHHLDFRGLIPIGLALEAPEGMYKTE